MLVKQTRLFASQQWPPEHHRPHSPTLQRLPGSAMSLLHNGFGAADARHRTVQAGRHRPHTDRPYGLEEWKAWQQGNEIQGYAGSERESPMPDFEGSGLGNEGLGLGNEGPGQGSEGQAIVWKAEGWRMKHADQLGVDCVELTKAVVIAMCL